MAVPFFKVYHTPSGGETTEITSSVMITQKRGLDIKSGKVDLDLNLSPYRNKSGGESVFQEEGLIEIYADYDEITDSSAQLIISSQIRKINPSFAEGGAKLKLTCADRTTLLLGSLWSKNYTSTDAPTIIQNIIAQTSNEEVTTTNVASTKSDAGAFASINSYSQSFKSIYEWITELSEPGYTGDDRAYLFYVDKDNDLHWFYPAQTSSGTIAEGTDDIYDMNLTRNSDAVINMIIFNAGQDLNGNGVLWYHYDATTKSNELKMKYQPMVELSTGQGAMMDMEIDEGNLVENTSGTVPYKGKLYNAATSGTTSWGATFSTFNEYNDEVRAYLKEKGVERAKATISRFGKLIWSGSVRLKGTQSYVAGDLITFTSRTLGIQSQLLRVQDVTQSFQKTGWTTTLELKEDEDAIAASVPGS